MEITFTLKKEIEKKDPIDVTESFPMTTKMREKIKSLSKDQKTILNENVRRFLEQYFAKYVE